MCAGMCEGEYVCCARERMWVACVWRGGVSLCVVSIVRVENRCESGREPMCVSSVALIYNLLHLSQSTIYLTAKNMQGKR